MVLSAELPAYSGVVVDELVAQSVGRLTARAVVHESSEDEVRFLDGVDGTHPVGCQAESEASGDLEIPLDHPLPSVVIAFGGPKEFLLFVTGA